MMTQLKTNQDLSHTGFGWNAALLGGMASIGGSAFFGTFIINISLWYFIWQGLSINQAYEALGSGISSPTDVLSFVATAVSAFYGGYASAKFGNGHPLVQSAAVGGISVMFYIIMVFGPLSQPGSIWSVLLSLTTPIVSSLLAGFIYAKRS